MNNNEMSNSNSSSHRALNDNFLVPIPQKKIQTNINKIHPSIDSTDQLSKGVSLDLNEVSTILLNTYKLANSHIKSLNMNASTCTDRINLSSGLLDNNARPPPLQYNEDINKTCEKNLIDNNIMHQHKIIEQRNASLSFLGKKVQRDSLCEVLVNYLCSGIDVNSMKSKIKELEQTKEIISEDNIQEKIRTCLQRKAQVNADSLSQQMENTDANNINLENLKDVVAKCEKMPSNETNIRDTLKYNGQEALHELKSRNNGTNKKHNVINFETPIDQYEEGVIPSARYCNMGLHSDNNNVFYFNL
jgi:hypothetical protein